MKNATVQAYPNYRSSSEQDAINYKGQCGAGVIPVEGWFTGVLKDEWDFSSKQWVKNRGVQTEMLTYSKAQWYVVPGKYLQAFVLAKAWDVHGEWKILS